MKPNLPLEPTRRRNRILPARRRQLLAEFERSELSAAEFARQQGIAYTTLCAWRRRSAAQPGVRFAEIELVGSASAEPLVVELGRQARMRLNSAHQLELAARLLKQLEGLC
jgi:transposase-like protein